ncbi:MULTISPECIES: hypothetical protein [Sphingomonadaceae]|jgi:hypothetical protein|uniref:Uncharacterized protein n=1 Tax=Novosphingobium resinovorum TaxID=158500 RepID=A0A031JZI6_9SPHN|nr:MULTISPECIES: hypothetical protein [Sphingomonadaceae]AOR77572.1 hypothetical protein BES08_13015 [Novosphingobium resinovorum]EJU11453.1 hypothetical protein LH128_18864 [Sphingomonas sp. LH128]EZP82203.1 hypothetical protein BV97_02226 [Novosphingobium resinovorum]MBF7013004.1 hypothetical protein [Novosphingobium sp. HR1a]WJM27739.1 hypothetical protein QUC32_25610 [Novosphingobium resinovorum]
MRIDARNLLDRLGKNDFAYKEFEDRFSELELWPILEALLRDPRLQAIDQSEATVAAKPEPAPAEVVETYSGESLSSLFSRYGNGPAASIPADRRGGAQQQDVRAMLRHLSDLGSQGKI